MREKSARPWHHKRDGFNESHTCRRLNRRCWDDSIANMRRRCVCTAASGAAAATTAYKTPLCVWRGRRRHRCKCCPGCIASSVTRRWPLIAALHAVAYASSGPARPKPGSARPRIAWTPARQPRQLAELPLELREVIVARLWGGLTFEEIGQVVGCSLPTAHRRYQTGLAQLRERLEGRWTQTATTPTT